MVGSSPTTGKRSAHGGGEQEDDMDKTVQRLLAFLDESPSSYHAAAAVERAYQEYLRQYPAI